VQFILPSKDTLLEIHEIVIEYYGGLKGLLHSESLNSAVNRPKNYMHYDDTCDLHLVAAITLESIARTFHLFTDGNKRTALISMLMVYNMNGKSLSYDHMSNKKLEKLVLNVADEKYQYTIRRLRARIKRLVEGLEAL
jgi:death-on-curing family protein